MLRTTPKHMLKSFVQKSTFPPSVVFFFFFFLAIDNSTAMVLMLYVLKSFENNDHGTSHLVVTVLSYLAM